MLDVSAQIWDMMNSKQKHPTLTMVGIVCFDGLLFSCMVVLVLVVVQHVGDIGQHPQRTRKTKANLLNGFFCGG